MKIIWLGMPGQLMIGLVHRQFKEAARKYAVTSKTDDDTSALNDRDGTKIASLSVGSSYGQAQTSSWNKGLT